MLLQFFGRPDIVCIDESKYSGPGMCNASIACAGNPMILLTDDAGTLIRQALADFAAIVLAAVIDDQQFKVAKSLPQHRLYCYGNETLGIVNGHDNADGRLLGLGHIDASYSDRICWKQIELC
jgi:hypothetical protein